MMSKTILHETRQSAQPGLPRGVAALMALLLSAAMGNAAHAADTNSGGALYTKHCVSCHGGPGVKAAPGSPSFERGQGLMRPDMTLMQAVRKGKNAMPAFQGRLTNQEILDVIAYMRTLH